MTKQVLAQHLQKNTPRTDMQDGVTGSENGFGPDALQGVKQRAEMWFSKAHVIRSWKSHSFSTG